MSNKDMIDIIDKFNSLSIIGMDKNVGKTTALNYLIKNARGYKSPLALTSIGRDGEETDLVTYTEKPKIYVRRGTFIATARQCLMHSDITREIIDTTGINTAMGEVVIIKALSDGYVDLGGPSTNTYISKICSKLLQLGAKTVFVDGALGRKTFASPGVTEATILATGASLGKDMNGVVEKTCHAAALLRIPKEEKEDIVSLCNKTAPENRVNIIYKNNTLKHLNNETSLAASKDIVYNLNENVSHVYIKGIVSDKLLSDIMKSTDEYRHINFIAEDGTKIFINQETLKKFYATGGRFRVLNPINLLCITCNPRSPYGYEFDKELFLNKLRVSMDLPVFDVLNETSLHN